MISKCPNCGKVVKTAGDQQETQPAEQYFPFCCERCSLVDLGAWLDGKYRITENESEEEGDSLAD